MAPAVGAAHSLSLMGLEARSVLVEAVLLGNLPNVTIVGLGDTAVSEARERLRASFSRIGISMPNQRLTVNLSPADMVKSGTGFDLAIAVATLGAMGYRGFSDETVIIGELGLDGAVRAVRGVVPCALAAVKLGYRRIVVPAANEAEAHLVSDLQVVPVRHIAQVAALLGVPGVDFTAGEADIVPEYPAGGQLAGAGAAQFAMPEELADVYGQEEAIWALEVAAAGGHHVQFVGAPGIGKSMLAQRFPAILPDLAEQEAVEVAAIRSLGGLRVSELPKRRPFAAPHHTATTPALVGGGNGIPQPGAITYAHRGVLFCDELPEFSPHAIQALRQPMETGWVDLHRARAHIRYPAKFQLIAAANPCRCGHALDGSGACVCTPKERQIYRSKLGGPIRDRFDIRIVLRRPSKAALAMGGQISTAQARSQVLAASARSQARIAADSALAKVPNNAGLPGRWLRAHTKFSAAMENALDQQLTRGALSLRGFDRILRVAWSVADLNAHATPTDDDMAMAFTLRGAEDIYGE